jgi:UDP-glucose 4-epimerase
VDKALVKGKRVLITGGVGLLAGRIATHLARGGYRVALATRNKETCPMSEPAIEVVQIDWQDATSLRALCCDVDIVINAMGMNAYDCSVDPAGAINVNGVYTSQLLQAAISGGVRRFLQLSTAHVYSKDLVGKVTERTQTTNVHPYASSHLVGDLSVLWAEQRGEIEVAVLRLSNVFGRPVLAKSPCWTLLVNELCRQAIERRSLKIRSSGGQHRDFVPLAKVSELVAEFCAIEKIDDLKIRAKDPSVFNVGSGFSMSVRRMAEIVQERYVLSMGQEIYLVIPDTQQKEHTASFNFLSHTMKNPIRVEFSDFISEIDELLLFCRNNFEENLGK